MQSFSNSEDTVTADSDSTLFDSFVNIINLN
jgi:hypothetical protein